jgi:hypothetical protein
VRGVGAQPVDKRFHACRGGRVARHGLAVRAHLVRAPDPPHRILNRGGRHAAGERGPRAEPFELGVGELAAQGLELALECGRLVGFDEAVEHPLVAALDVVGAQRLRDALFHGVAGFQFHNKLLGC